ncbi:efflux RND transporter permease subunit [Paraburkholderia megapolitana]|uniref:Multidrug efflux pump subunit AcrB n=1 Tax=Paraburkholderia megapolitana TaxID=420953 RepID=A0A1I3EUL0_9BURK|nr:efflux RND transporter permease subunit [Paraburkholderia megapolitana]QDQ80290.1 efflux RND transporter permease subunit [Paraburkholderia megapolitana]SFI02659.1 Multidrug efflux pump subunit AcrB [Paraburkholderia megapolitana]
MNAIVRIALARPYTFVVMALLIMIAGGLAAFRTPTDIFPNIRIPVIAVAWTYPGLSPEDMSGRIELPFQRSLTTTVNDIEHIEGLSLTGIGITKIYFQPGADIRMSNAQVTAIAQTMLRQLPPGTVPPFILNYSASTVPIVQLAISGTRLSEQQLYDYGLNFVRSRLVTVPGAAIPYPYGGRVRQIQMDLDPHALQSSGVSANDVAAALSNQTQITPAGFVKIDEYQYNFRLNNAPPSVEQLNLLPIRTVNGAVIRMGDVAHVRDGSAPQQNIVHVDGQRSTLLTVLKSGAASTIAIVNGVKAMLPDVLKGLPKALTVTPINDQSIFVKSAVADVAREGAIAAALTSLMILLFLGSWRSTLIVATSIPLSVLGAVAALSAFGQTFNVMTLGGLALAVGILVDEATVTIENIEWHLEQGKDVRTAILDGAQQIVVPAFLSLACICIVFVPMFYLPGVSGFLFVPMALSVIFAMVTSFLLSRTLVPTMAMYLLRHHAKDDAHPDSLRGGGRLARFQRGFERRFETFRARYGQLLQTILGNRRIFVLGFLGFTLASLLIAPFLGRNFFPQVDGGSFTLHVRGPIGMRIEETSALFQRIERQIAQEIPAAELASVTDNIGLPNSPTNTVYDSSGTIGPQDGNIIVALRHGHEPTARYVHALRAALPAQFPEATFAFLPSDITSQILNFGAPAPIDIQITSMRTDVARQYAEKVLREIRRIDGLVDARIQQPASYPELRFDADRTRINQLGLDEVDVTNSIATSIAGTSQTAPIYWLNPQNKVTYPVVIQMPEYRVNSLNDIADLPVTANGTAQPQVLGALGTIKRGTTSAVETQYNIRPLIDVYAGVDGRDLGAVADDVRNALQRLDKDRPETVTVTLRGQYESMNTAFSGMGYGLLGAVVLIYLLIVINFQSWVDPFIIVSALPAALAGICWMLFATGTPLSVPALTGAIMCMGVATANSILVVSFARERLAEHGNPARAALEAGMTRLRPVLMTALAMIIGMAPMALGLGEGGEQNAPLGRAVIGGLAFATWATTLFVPTLFAILHGRPLGRRSDFEGALTNV